MTVLELPTPDPRALDESARPFAEAIASRYAIKRLIGSGGMGMVYLARDKRLDRLVAIKTLPPQLASDPIVRERFLRETRTAAGMTHPNIVGIHGADEVDGHVFFVMTYVKGTSLAAQIGARGRLDADTATRFLRDVASALAHAHARGIVHRDIKAENILIDDDTGNALVSDFGIARLAEASPLTVTGQVLGSVYYVSPEQVSGNDVDVRTDIYSLGVVGYLALTGRFPFNAELASAVMLQHVTQAPAPVSSRQADVPPALAAIVDRCLSKNPSHRFSSADDLLAALMATGLGDAGASARTPMGTNAARPSIRVSDDEAQQLWQRAAELQAATGLHPRPPVIPRARDLPRDLARSEGFALDDVRAAGMDAGIGEEYIMHALGEHGLLPRAQTGGDARTPAGVRRTTRSTPRTILPGSEDAARISWWARVPLKVTQELHVEGELPASELDRLVEITRMSTGKVGETLARHRELAWQQGMTGGRLQVSVVPDAEHTTVRVVQDLRRSIYARAGATVAVSLLAVLPLAVGALMEMVESEDAAVFGAMAITSLTVWQVGKRLIRRAHRKLSTRTARLADRLAGAVAEAIERGR